MSSVCLREEDVLEGGDEGGGGSDRGFFLLVLLLVGGEEQEVVQFGGYFEGFGVVGDGLRGENRRLEVDEGLVLE